MSIRNLAPWLLAGALLASAYANMSMYRAQGAPLAPLASGTLDDSIAAFHLDPDAADGHCPTLDLLELSEDQRDSIRRCSLTSLDLRTDLAIEISAASAELEQGLSGGDTDGERILELADHISELRSRQYRAWIGSILVVREVLSPEQLQRLHELETN